MKNWKTTLGGALLALVPVISNVGTTWAYWLAEGCKIVGPLLLGLAAKDAGGVR